MVFGSCLFIYSLLSSSRLPNGLFSMLYGLESMTCNLQEIYDLKIKEAHGIDVMVMMPPMRSEQLDDQPARTDTRLDFC